MRNTEIRNNVINIRSLFSGLLLLSVAFCASLASTPVIAKTAYVSDELTVPMRSGASNGHRIVKFLKSGTVLKVLSAEGKYTQVEALGKTGWILTDQMMDIPSGRDRLAAAKKKFANADQVITELENKVSELKAEIRALKKEKGSLQNERTNLSNSLEDLKITAANPLALSKKNKELKKELEKVRANEDMLEKDNQQLRSNVMQEWFIIGGGVSIGSLLLGIILTRINWRRKRDSWGGGF
jgi:SH3 domain protein